MPSTPPAPRRDPAHTLDLLWRTHQPPRRGPRGSLSVERVVDTAVDIADAEGLDAVSMRRVAEALGVTTMSLYRYVPSRDELGDLMLDHASEAPDTSGWPDDWDWRSRLSDVMHQMWALYERRPWLLDVPLNTPPMGPRNIAWMEAGVGALEGSGLDADDRMGAFSLVTVYLRGEALTQLSLRRAAPRTGVTPEAWGVVYGDMLRRAVADGRFPALTRIVENGVFSRLTDTGEDFRYGLDFMLDGVAALIDRRAAEAAGERADDAAGASEATGDDRAAGDDRVG